MATTTPAQAAGALDTIQQQYQSASSSWMNAAIPYANHLFAGLAALEFSWAGVQYLLRKNDLPEFLASVTLKVLSIGFFFTLLTMAPAWLSLIIASFTQAGAAVSGTAALTPSGVFSLGPQVASQIIAVLGTPSMGLQALGSYFLSSIIAGLSGLIIVIAYAIAALQLLMTLIESYIVIGGGLIMLGFLGSRWTLPFGEKYFGYAISVGIKLFVLYLIIGMGPSMANAIMSDLQTAAAAAGTGSPPPGTFLTAAASSLIFGALAFMVPGLAGSLMNGSPYAQEPIDPLTDLVNREEEQERETQIRSKKKTVMARLSERDKTFAEMLLSAPIDQVADLYGLTVRATHYRQVKLLKRLDARSGL